jgi:3-hydroxyisobutyrate dehydrogenase
MKTNSVSRIGFIGAGLMGAPMVRRLLAADFRIRVWNRSADKLYPLLAAGAEAATSAADAANGMDAVFLCLSNSAAVESVLFAEEGVASAALAPPLLVDCSDHWAVDTLAFAGRLCAQCGTQWVDAPVSGGTTGAEQGWLVIFCGGTTANIARLVAAFDSLAQRYTRIGDIGAGRTQKLCNQLIVATNLAAITEALVLARASGLDLPAVPPALAGGFADSIPMQIFGTRMAAGVTTPMLGELSLMLKDLRAVAALAVALDQQLLVSAAALEVYQTTEEPGLSRKNLVLLCHK